MAPGLFAVSAQALEAPMAADTHFTSASPTVNFGVQVTRFAGLVGAGWARRASS